MRHVVHANQTQAIKDYVKLKHFDDEEGDQEMAHFELCPLVHSQCLVANKRGWAERQITLKVSTTSDLICLSFKLLWSTPTIHLFAIRLSNPTA